MARKKNDAAPAPVRLSGGNPQIPKGDGDEPVQAYLAALPGWKERAGREIDALVVSAVPGVRKAVRWNTPFYGIEGQGWFLAFHCMTKYIKVAFLNGSALEPMPPVASKIASTRYWHIFENDPIDAIAAADWIRQAAALPGEKLFP
jgi:hypothetical protein